MRSACTDLGMQTTPRWISQRSTTCATVFLYLAAIASRISFENSPFLPSAKGAHDSICTPFVRMNSAAAVCWWNGWVSTWLTAGTISLCRIRS